MRFSLEDPIAAGLLTAAVLFIAGSLGTRLWLAVRRAGSAAPGTGRVR